MNHLQEQEIETYVLTPEQFSQEVTNLFQEHLNDCELCYEHVQRLRAFYTAVAEGMKQPATERDKAFAEQLTTPLKPRLALPSSTFAQKEDAIDAYVEIIEPEKRNLPSRVYHFFRFHPIQATVRTSLAAALVFFTYYFFTPKNVMPPPLDTNPNYARAEKEFLVTYNKDGRELWRKHIGIGYDIESRLRGSQNKYENYLATLDVDNDGKKEVIANIGFVSSYPRKKEIICFNTDGTERWSYAMTQEMTFGTEHMTGNYLPSLFMAGDFDHNGTGEVTVFFNHDTYYPSPIVHLQGSSGEVLGIFWHIGNISNIAHRDVDKDGVDELLFAAQNNAFDNASLTVLDPRVIAGYSPADSTRTPMNTPEGTEKYYLLFPRCDIKLFATAKRNNADAIMFASESVTRINVAEYVGNDSYYQFYFLDSLYRCYRVDGEDWFLTFHRKMVKEGKLSTPVDSVYYQNLRKGVQYWDGEKFVNEPTMNKRYIETIRSSESSDSQTVR
ncbi:MAG: hypothetical protein HY960_08445 [Ignavibacteriae bacterium]|nr:hypothetical protein [Ignavibacteriota bacterium]